MFAFKRNILLLGFFLSLVDSWRSYDMDFHSYSYENLNTAILRSCHFSLIKYHGHKVLNGALQTARELNDLWVELSVSIPRPDGSNLSLIEGTLNACEALKSNSVNLIRIIITSFEKASASSFPKGCPIEMNKTIQLKNMYIDPELFPPYMPDMFFIAKFHLLTNGKYFFKSFLNGSSFNKKKFKTRVHSKTERKH